MKIRYNLVITLKINEFVYKFIHEGKVYLL